MPRAPENSSFRPTAPVAPSVRLDRIVSANEATLQGQVVTTDRSPIPNVLVLFVREDQVNRRQTATADAAGRFEVSLNTGSWLVYTQSRDGKTEFRRKIDVRADQPTEVRLVSR
jgi:hypothetical protein